MNDQRTRSVSVSDRKAKEIDSKIVEAVRVIVMLESLSYIPSALRNKLFPPGPEAWTKDMAPTENHLGDIFSAPQCGDNEPIPRPAVYCEWWDS
ncbi:hypothetical protein IG631_19603 [Alternaria alternata]|nr:hypothetical protein IG631_19603 [Alternaria alternata]